MSNDAAIMLAARRRIAPFLDMGPMELRQECARLSHLLEMEMLTTKTLQEKLLEKESSK